MGIGRQALNRAVFLDRDGVINAAVVRDGRPYPPATVGETRILGDVPQALALLKAADFRLAVITNQPDVAKGTQTRDEVEAINAFLRSQLPPRSFRGLLSRRGGFLRLPQTKAWIDRGYDEKSPVGYDYRTNSLLTAAKWILGRAPQV